jgi:hypothetical protein
LTHDYRQRKEFLNYRRDVSLRRRIGLLRGSLLAVFLLHLGSLWFFQVVRAEHYSRLSDSNRIRAFSVSPLRGVIRDRQGRVLAKNQPSFTGASGAAEAARSVVSGGGRHRRPGRCGPEPDCLPRGPPGAVSRGARRGGAPTPL